MVFEKASKQSSSAARRTTGRVLSRNREAGCEEGRCGNRSQKLRHGRLPPNYLARFPKEMAVRPSQIRASAAESALLIPNAYATCRRYKELAMPVIIIAGEEDQLVDTETQSARLDRELPRSVLHRISHTGHMAHQTATEAVMAAIDEAAEAGDEGGPKPSVPNIAEMVGPSASVLYSVGEGLTELTESRRAPDRYRSHLGL